MTNKHSDWDRQVEDSLKYYADAEKLGKTPALHWPQVKLMIKDDMHTVTAIRTALERGLDELAVTRNRDARLLRMLYKHDQKPDSIAYHLGLQPSMFYRHRATALKELAVILDSHRRMADRELKALRFVQKSPPLGIDGLVDDLVRHIRDSSAPSVIVVEGLGGLGKTTLAQMIAGRCAVDQTLSGVGWASAKQSEFSTLGAKEKPIDHAPIDADGIVFELAHDLGLPTHGSVSAIRSDLAALCRQQSFLIVIDNLESVTDMQAIATLVQQIAGRSRVLITTRKDTSDALPTALKPRRVNMPELDQPTSFALLRLAAQQNSASALLNADDSQLAKIYDVIGGNPLAIWLVAGQAAKRPIDVLIDQLVQHCPPGSKERNFYEYLYRVAWDVLSDRARDLLFAMHRFPGGAEYHELLELSELDQHEFNAAADELLNQMLLQFNGLYTVHRLTYSFLRSLNGW